MNYDQIIAELKMFHHYEAAAAIEKLQPKVPAKQEIVCLCGKHIKGFEKRLCKMVCGYCNGYLVYPCSFPDLNYAECFRCAEARWEAIQKRPLTVLIQFLTKLWKRLVCW